MSAIVSYTYSLIYNKLESLKMLIFVAVPKAFADKIRVCLSLLLRAFISCYKLYSSILQPFCMAFTNILLIIVEIEWNALFSSERFSNIISYPSSTTTILFYKLLDSGSINIIGMISLIFPKVITTKLALFSS
jgi:hypothetical protein